MGLRLFKTTRKSDSKGALPCEEPLLYPYCSGDWLLGLSPVLVFAPHPDDETFGCGGVLLLMSAGETEIHLVAVTDGGKGDVEGRFEASRYVEIRRKEFERVADSIGAQAIWWGMGDREIQSSREELARRGRDLILQVGPKLVFLPSPWEIHPDHRAVTEEILEVLAPSSKVAFYEGVVALRPNLLVDITRVADRKMELMKSYSSQVGLISYHEAIEGLNRHRTLTLSDSTHAEAFVVLDTQDARELLQTVRQSERYLLPAVP